ncbi:hypothetical protein ACFV9P_26450 [Streptomyces sp. NPDC059892]|uniref:hypothetical protein n=1 Tax=unclassified Streptomyces TaxID=2593676 RepID=UPI003650425F
MFSEDCSVSGEIYTSAAGQVARFFAGRTRGYHNPALTAECVRDHLDRIRDESDSFIPVDPVVETAHPLRSTTRHP